SGLNTFFGTTIYQTLQLVCILCTNIIVTDAVSVGAAHSSSSTIFEVLEEAGPGTVIIDNLQHRLHLTPELSSGQLQQEKLPYAAIGNPSSPGIEGLEIRPNRFDGSLQLIVREKQRGPDREHLCNTQYSRKTDPMAPCDITLVILHGNRQTPSYARITLRVLDINDNTPTFPEGINFELRIPEDVGEPDLESSSLHNSNLMPRNLYSPGGRNERALTVIPLPTAFDSDLPINGIKFYRLTTNSGQEVDTSLFSLINNTTEGDLSSSSYGSVFHSVRSPALKVVGRLDREKVSDYQFHLLAIDGGVPQRTGTLSIHLVITDLNDNAPRFRKPIYHQPSFDQAVELNDRSVLYEILRIPETLPTGTNLASLIAEDPDQGANAQVSYRMKDHLTNGDKTPGSGINPFGLIQSNGTVTLCVIKQLDADGPGGRTLMEHNRPIYGQLNKVIVEAVDHGSPPLTGTITLAILVENVNDNRPDIAVQFADPMKLPTIYGQQNEAVVVGGLMENAITPLTIAHLTVTDGDVVSQEFGNLHQVDGVRCETNDTRFVLEQMQSMSAQGTPDRQNVASSHASLSLYFYRLSVIRPIDRELAEWVYVQVTCVDQVRTDHTATVFNFSPINAYTSSTQLTGTVTVTLKILDVNDNSPLFDKDVYQFTVFETLDKHDRYMQTMTVPEEQRTRIGAVRATDVDSGNNGLIAYYLLTNPNEAFSVDERTGEIWRVGALDRERETQLDLRIEARDKGEPSLSSTCLARVKILDINDHSPYWISSNENTLVGSSVYRFGKSEDGVFYFSVYENLEVGNTVGSVRAIDVDGTIENELVALPSPVRSMENPFMSGEDALGPSVVDSPLKESESKIIYQLENVDDARLFSINWHTGELRLNQKLDRETRAHYELRVFAIDNPPAKWTTSGGSKYPTTDYWERLRKRRFTATATIIITVLDVNDNAPQFDSPLVGQEFHLEPGSIMSAPGTTLFTAKAHDADTGENATVRYLLEGGGYDLVEIDPTTGVCYLREAIQPHRLIALMNNHELPITERLLNPRTTSEQAEGQPNELRSLSLTLNIIAHDMGKPMQLNSSRTVRLVWNGGDSIAGDLHSAYNRNSLFGQAYNVAVMGSGKLSYTERLFIPLIVGAFLLLFIICLILFGIFRHRRHSKTQRTNSTRGQLTRPLQTTHSPDHSSRSPWSWCLPSLDRVKSSRQARPVIKHNIIGRGPLLEPSIEPNPNPMSQQRSDLYLTDSTTPYKTAVSVTTGFGRNCETSLDVFLPNAYRSCLPDCVPSSDVEIGHPAQIKPISHVGSTTKRPMNLSSACRPRYAGGRLSRAFSEESLAINRPNDMGYTALCAYPSAFPDQTAFIPGLHRLDLFDPTYNATQKRADQLNFSPFTNRRGPRGPNHPSTFAQPRSGPAHPIESHTIYSPLSVATTCNLTYPTLQPLPYGSETEDANERYEAFELAPEFKSTSETNTSRGGSGWKAKVSDSYAENTFV
ncbi:Protocadherin-11 X-linked, partial [Fasciola gigantica]